jgi:hypothetical protein
MFFSGPRQVSSDEGSGAVQHNFIKAMHTFSSAGSLLWFYFFPGMRLLNLDSRYPEPGPRLAGKHLPPKGCMGYMFLTVFLWQ